MTDDGEDGGSGVNRSTATDGSAPQVALAEVMSGLARAAAAASPVVAGCALTYATPSLATDRDLALTLLIRGGSDDFALAMESIQDQIGEGPSMAARTGGAPVSVVDIQAELARWPVFAMAARAHGLHAVHAEPLITPDGRRLGAISWYAQAPGIFRADAQRLVAHASEAAATLALSRRLLDLQVQPDDLSAALASRVAISQAVGIVMERQGCDADTAFAELQSISRRENRALPSVAALLVERAESPRGRDPVPSRTNAGEMS